MEEKDAIEIIRKYAQDAVDVSNNLDDQKEYIWNQIEGDMPVMKILARRSFNELAMGTLYHLRNIVKREIIDPSAPNETKRTFAVMMAAKSTMDAFYCGSKPIGDCDKEELLHQAQIHQNRGSAELVRANIFNTVAKKVKDGLVVRDCIDDSQFNRIIANCGKRKAG